MRSSFSRNWTETRKVESSMHSTASDWAGPIRILAALEQLWEFSTVVNGHFQLNDPVSKRIRVAREGTRASFSTVLAFGVLEIFGSPLALS